MENLEFYPVVPKSKNKSFKVKPKTTRFPLDAVIILSEVTEGSSRMLMLSELAIKLLNLSDEAPYFGITKGYTNAEMTDEALFIFSTDEVSYPFVSDKGNEIKMDSAKFKASTMKAKNAKFHNLLTSTHSDSTGSSEKYFKLKACFGDKYWLLEEFTPLTPFSVVVANTIDQNDGTTTDYDNVEITLD